MPLQIVVVPASTKAGRETIRQLLESQRKPLVRGIYRDPSKAPVEFTQHPRFEAKEGNVATGTSLDLSSADAVFYIPPPTYDGTDQGEWATRCAGHVKDAIRQAPNVRRLVLLSALGSHHDHGIGVLRLNHVTDTVLKDAVREVVIVRPGFFQEEFASALETAQADPPVVHSWITPIDHKIPMVSLKDIARTVTNALLAESAKPSPHVTKILGPRPYGALDLKHAVEQATGKAVDLRLVEKEELAAFFGQHGIPEAHVGEFVEFSEACLPGGLIDGATEPDENTVIGETELTDTFRELYAKGAGRA
ncbi:NAD(P)-binding protein [Parathielavia appendiculata]|uniref:NAD(P)-binding protein n=1 Tax=Parathielavia appendiculata TaxID=2587402 RepID=A0AAN6TVQ0_9PEZI|nr:NAD(P)-binding protein [Parathielavia appendiculata]